MDSLHGRKSNRPLHTHLNKLAPTTINDTMKLFIPVICYNHTCHTSYMFSLLKLILVLKEMGIPASIFPITFDSLINRARNAATAYFMSDSDHTHMLFIDADIEFKVKDIIALIEANRPIIGIGYAQKWLNTHKLQTVFSTVPLPENPLELCTNDSIHSIPIQGETGNIREAEYCTTGCLLIQRPAIEKMMIAYPERQYKNDVDGYMGAVSTMFYNLFPVEINPTTKRFESEDYAFCRLWRALDEKIHVLTDATLVHYGWFGYSNNIRRQEDLFAKPE